MREIWNLNRDFPGCALDVIRLEDEPRFDTEGGYRCPRLLGATQSRGRFRFARKPADVCAVFSELSCAPKPLTAPALAIQILADPP